MMIVHTFIYYDLREFGFQVAVIAAPLRGVTPGFTYGFGQGYPAATSIKCYVFSRFMLCPPPRSNLECFSPISCSHWGLAPMYSRDLSFSQADWPRRTRPQKSAVHSPVFGAHPKPDCQRRVKVGTVHSDWSCWVSRCGFVMHPNKSCEIWTKTKSVSAKRYTLHTVSAQNNPPTRRVRACRAFPFLQIFRSSFLLFLVSSETPTHEGGGLPPPYPRPGHQLGTVVRTHAFSDSKYKSNKA